MSAGPLLTAAAAALVIGLVAEAFTRWFGARATSIAAGLWWAALVRLALPSHMASPLGLLGPVAYAGSGGPGAQADAAASLAVPIGLALWGAIAAALLLWRLVSWRREHRAWLGRSRPVPTDRGPLHAALASCGVDRSVRWRRVEVRLADGLGPACLGVLRPRIVLSSRWLETASPRALQAALLHELAHAARRDGLKRLAAECLRCVFWWHPVSHLAARRLAELSEFAADRAAATAMAGGRAAYRRGLLEATAGTTQAPTFAAAPLGARRAALLRRLDALERRAPARRRYGVQCLAPAAFALPLACLAPAMGTAPRAAPPPAVEVPSVAFVADPAPAAPAAPALDASALREMEGCLQRRYAVLAALHARQ